MKLHLPLSLRSALLAVLSLISVAFSAIVVDVLPGETKSTIPGGDSVFGVGDVTINISEGGTYRWNSSSYGYMLTKTSEVNVDGRFEFKRGTIGWKSDDYKNAYDSTINIGATGELIMDGGNIGIYQYTARKSANDVKGSIARVNIQNIFEMYGGMVGLLYETQAGMYYADEKSKVEFLIEKNGRFIFHDGCFGGKYVTFTIKDNGEIDMNSQGMNSIYENPYSHQKEELDAPNITLAGGKLINAENYSGEIKIISDELFRGNIALGGVNAARIQQLQTGAGVTVSGMTGALTIHEGDFMYVGAGSIGVDGREGETPMLSFSDSGSISFGANGTITLYFDDDAFDDIARTSDGKTTFEIWFADGGVFNLSESNFVFGDNGDWEITDIQDGKLIVNGTLPDLVVGQEGKWYASQHVGEEDGLLTEEGKMPSWKYSHVIVDRDASLEISSATMMSHLQGDSNLTLTGSGEVELSYAKEDAEFAGTLSSSTGVSLTKTGGYTLTVSGSLQAEGAINTKPNERR